MNDLESLGYSRCFVSEVVYHIRIERSGRSGGGGEGESWKRVAGRRKCIFTLHVEQ